MNDPAIGRPAAVKDGRSTPVRAWRGTAGALLDTRLSGIVLMLVLATLWDLSARTKVIDLISWPPFFDIAARWVELTAGGAILAELGTSVWRVFLGYGIAVAVAVPIGVLIGYSRRIHNLLEPTLESIRPIPVVAIIPVIILFLGLEHAMKVFIIAYACFFPILLNTIAGVRNVDTVLIDTTRTFGLTRRQTILKVMVPAATPFIFTGMRISVGFSLMAMAAAEMLTGGDGIGAFILDAQRTFKIQDMYAGIITLGFLGYAANRGFIGVEQWVLRWHGGGRTDGE